MQLYLFFEFVQCADNLLFGELCFTFKKLPRRANCKHIIFIYKTDQRIIFGFDTDIIDRAAVFNLFECHKMQKLEQRKIRLMKKQFSVDQNAEIRLIFDQLWI